MIILGIDSASPHLSLAITKNDTILSEKVFTENQRHSEKILDVLDEVIKESGMDKSQIDAIAIDIGPGPFTSVRIGVSTARALSQFLKIDIIPVSSLEILNAMVLEKKTDAIESYLIPLLDAKKNKVYTAIFKNSNYFQQEMDIEPNNLNTMLKEIKEKKIIFGSGLEVYSEIILEGLNNLETLDVADFSYPSASACAKLAFNKIQNNDTFHYNHIKPNYIRKSDAEISLNMNKK